MYSLRGPQGSGKGSKGDLRTCWSEGGKEGREERKEGKRSERDVQQKMGVKKVDGQSRGGMWKGSGGKA